MDDDELNDAAPAAEENAPVADQDAETQADAPETGAEVAQDDVDAEEPDFGEGLVDENGKLLGKFGDVPSLARSYKELEKTFGKKSGQAAEYRKAMEAAGWSFDESGKPVAPSKPETAAPVAVAAAAPPAQDPNLPTGHTLINGVEHDHLGMPVITQEEWDTLQEDDPEAYQRIRNVYDVRRTMREEQYQQVQSGHAAQRMQEVQTQARETAKGWGFDDAAVTEIEAEVQKTLAQSAPHVRSNPDAYNILAKAAAADRIPAMLAAHKEEIRQILAGNKEAIAKGQKTIAVEKGTVRPAPTAQSKAASSLTAAEKQMAKSFGMSEEDYARNK